MCPPSTAAWTTWSPSLCAPVDDRSLRAGLYNLSLHNTRADLLRACLEGIAFNTRWLLAPVERFMRRKVSSLNVVGGGAQSDAFCQIFADVLGVEVRQVEHPLCANARGAAWIGAVGLGRIGFNDLPGLVRFRQTCAPNPANRVLYNERFEVFKQVYRQMKGVYRRMNS